MATVNLGSIKFKWQGAYAGGTSYTIDDVVSYNGSSYICKLASTGNLPTNTTYWDQMSSAGTNGTDLTTTLTTQGDIVYRDGSGLQRLGAGTAGQVLQTGGAGANPSWSTVSSDVVKLAESTLSSNSNSISIDGYFSATYDNYYVDIYDVDLDASCDIYLRHILNNSVESSSTYYGSAFYIQNTSTNPTWNQNRDWGNTQTRINSGGLGTGTGDGSFWMRMYISKPLSTTNYKFIRGQYQYVHNTSAEYNDVIFSSICNVNQNPLTGVHLFASGSNNFTRGTIKVYGLK